MPPSNPTYCDVIIQELKEMCDYSLGKSDWVTMTIVTCYFVTMLTIVKDLLIKIIQEIAWQPKSDWTAFSTLCFFPFDCYLLIVIFFSRKGEKLLTQNQPLWDPLSWGQWSPEWSQSSSLPGQTWPSQSARPSRPASCSWPKKGEQDKNTEKTDLEI